MGGKKGTVEVWLPAACAQEQQLLSLAARVAGALVYAGVRA